MSHRQINEMNPFAAAVVKVWPAWGTPDTRLGLLSEGKNNNVVVVVKGNQCWLLEENR